MTLPTMSNTAPITTEETSKNGLFKLGNLKKKVGKFSRNAFVTSSMIAHTLMPSFSATTAIKLVGGTALGALTVALTGCGDSPNNVIPQPPEDKEAPKITRYLPTLEIPKGITPITIKGNNLTVSNDLYIGDTKVATGKDNMSKTGERIIKDEKTGSQIQGYISESCDLIVTIKDESGNISTPPIKIKVKMLEGGNEPLISGLDSIRNLELHVDEKVNLLNGISFSNNVDRSSLKIFVEFEGTMTEVFDPYYYTFPFPGDIKIIYKFKYKDGKDENRKNYEEIVSNYIEPLKYNEPVYEIANLYEINFPWAKHFETYDEIDFRKWPLTGAEIASESAPLNCYYIIVGEDIDDEYVSEQLGKTTNNLDKKHGDNVANRIYQLTGTKPKAYYDNLENFTNWVYDNYEQGYLYLVSSAYHEIDGESSDEVINNPHISSFIKMLDDYEDLTYVQSAGNKGKYDKVYNCDIQKGYHNISSVNSINYKVTTTGYYPGNNFFSNSPLYGNQSLFTEGYDGEKNNNYVISTHCGIDIDNTDNTSTQSSYSSPIITAELGNAIRIIKDANPLITNTAARNLVFTNYLKKEPILFIDEDGNTLSSSYCYIIDFEKITNEQVLHLEEIAALQLNSTGLTKIEPLNKNARLYGPGVGFIGDDGEFHTFTTENINLYDPNNVYFYGDQYRKYGLMGGNATITTFAVDRYGKKMENTKKTIDIKIH